MYKVQRQLGGMVDPVGMEGGVHQALGRLHSLGEGYGGGGEWMRGKAISMCKGPRP